MTRVQDRYNKKSNIHKKHSQKFMPLRKCESRCVILTLNLSYFFVTQKSSSTTLPSGLPSLPSFPSFLPFFPLLSSLHLFVLHLLHSSYYSFSFFFYSNLTLSLHLNPFLTNLPSLPLSLFSPQIPCFTSPSLTLPTPFPQPCQPSPILRTIQKTAVQI